jgi:serine/threonine protein phosphatase PrpC/serine/threonine protein kinase
MFPPESEVIPPPAAAPSPPDATPGRRLANRYEVGERLGVRGAAARYRGLDYGIAGKPVPVIVVATPFVARPAESATTQAEGPPDAPPPPPLEEDRVPLGEQPAAEEPDTACLSGAIEGLPMEWPGLGWECRLLGKIDHPSIPRLLDRFAEDDHYYVIVEAFAGQSLWDAWEDPAFTPAERLSWLAELAGALKTLHDHGAVLEGLRPDIVVITSEGHAGLTNLNDLLPLPLPLNAPIQASLYTAPELILDSENADARSDLYSFGAMLYALYLGRELTEMDFERQGVPKPLVFRFPDVHPGLARIIMKTFNRQKEGRFPTDEAQREDPTGFTELARSLRAVGRAMSNVRLDIACWTTTGMVRTGNEDAFAVLHAAASKQDDLGERALLILADGMGGYEAGEVASAMAIDFLRQRLQQERQFAGLTGDPAQPPGAFDAEGCQATLVEALRELNRHVFTAARTPGTGRRGMGCTAEVVYVDGQRMVVGHVGDSRTYHYSQGRLVQITRDQTLVNRLVELGQLTPEEAEDHPRKNELQQAIGGQPVVDPLTYHVPLRLGDWVVVCSDGLTNHVNHDTLLEMIQRADSAEMLARRLCNLANLYGGSDNCTVIAVRAT